MPPDPYMSGTLSGDMILNSSADLNPSDLFDVALHEAGLALGLGESTDPSSVMYPVLNPQATLSPSDIQNIQALYGIRAPDPNDNTIATATPISQPPLYVGTTPLVAYGDLATPSDTDFYSVQPPLLYSGPVTIQLQTSGISFLQPQVQVYNQNFKLLGEAQSTSDLGDIVTVQLPSVNPLQRYYIEVDSPATGRLRDRSLRVVGHVRRPLDREPRQLAAHSPRAVRLPERGRHRRAAQRRGQRAVPEQCPGPQRHVPDRRAAVEPARLSGEQPV